MTNRDRDKTASTTHEIDAPVDDVWEAFTSAEGWGRWMGDGSHIDAEPDGELAANDIATGTQRSGRVVSVEPGERLAFEWWPDDDPDSASHVVIEVTPSPGGSTVTITESAPRLRIVAATETAALAPALAWHWRAAMAAVSTSQVRA